MDKTRIRRPRPCHMCGDFDSTNGDNVVERRRIEIPGGQWVHFACLGDWLIDAAMDHWLGPMKSHERSAMRERLGLPRPARRTLPSLSRAAESQGYTGAWLSAHVQGPAIEHLKKQVLAADAHPDSVARDRERRLRIRKLAEEIVELATSMPKAAS